MKSPGQWFPMRLHTVLNAWKNCFNLLLMTALPLLALGIASDTSASPVTTVRTQGKLVYRTSKTHDIWKIASPGGDLVYKLPGQPLDVTGEKIPVGSILALDCTLEEGSRKSCAAVSNAAVTRAAAPVRSTEVTLRLLVMVVSLNDSCTRGSAQVDQVQAMYKSDYTDFLRNCSYGKVKFAPGDAGVTVIGVTIPCNAAILMCEEDAVSYFAKEMAINQTNASFVASFNRFTYVMPYGLTSCRWVGLADLPGVNTWYTPYLEGVFSKGTVLQETLHNFGIYHGWRDGIEYADYSTSMGSGNSCPSAPELWRLGWATPQDLLDSSNMPVGTIKSYMLPATSVDNSRNMIKIRPDWLGALYIRNVYFALRLKTAGDKDLDESFNRKISVHHLNKIVDNTFTASGDPKVNLLRTISDQSTADLVDYNLFIWTGALLDDGSRISLRICRYLTSATECQGAATNSGSAHIDQSTYVAQEDYIADSPPPIQLPPPKPRSPPHPRPPRPPPPSPQPPRPSQPPGPPRPLPPRLPPPPSPQRPLTRPSPPPKPPPLSSLGRTPKHVKAPGQPKLGWKLKPPRPPKLTDPRPPSPQQQQPPGPNPPPQWSTEIPS